MVALADNLNDPDPPHEDSLDKYDPLEEASRLVDTAEMAYCIGWRWASFELYVISPVI